MADTGEDREIKQRFSAHQAEIVRRSNQLEQRAKLSLPVGRRVINQTGRHNCPLRWTSSRGMLWKENPRICELFQPTELKNATGKCFNKSSTLNDGPGLDFSSKDRLSLAWWAVTS